jgi:hypothetical protein
LNFQLYKDRDGWRQDLGLFTTFAARMMSFLSAIHHMITSSVHSVVMTKEVSKWDNLNRAIMILLNWKYAILTHMSVTVVAPTWQ